MMWFVFTFIALVAINVLCGLGAAWVLMWAWNGVAHGVFGLPALTYVHMLMIVAVLIILRGLLTGVVSFKKNG